MLNPETHPCSIEQLFNLPPPPAPEMTPIATELPPKKPNTVIAERGIVVDPVIAPPIAPVNKKRHGLSNDWWIVIAGVGGIVLGFALATWLRNNKEKRKEKDPANSN